MKYIERALVSLLCVLLIVSPEYFFKNDGLVFMFKATMLSAVLMLLFFSKIQRLMPAYLCLALLLIMLFLALVVGVLPWVSHAIASASIVFPFFLLCLKFRDRQYVLTLVKSSPLLCLLISVVGYLAWGHEIFRVEFTGVSRLQGTLIPAHLAFLCFVALLASFLDFRADKDLKWIIANMMIVAATGSRMAMFLSFMLVGSILVRELSLHRAKKKTALISLVILVAVSVVGWYSAESILARTVNSSAGAIGIDASGRIGAWSFYLQKASGSEWFGRGVGAVVEANAGHLHEGFKTPHNEYVRYYYDLGLVGSAVFWVFIISVMRCYGIWVLSFFLLYSFTDNTTSTHVFIIPFLLVCATANGRQSGVIYN